MATAGRRGGVVHDEAGGRRRWYRRGPEGEVLGVQLLGRGDRRAFAYDHDGERVAAYRFTGGTLDEVRYTIRDERGNVLSDILRVDGAFTREADRVYMGRDEQVRLVYGAGGAVTYATAGRDHLGSLRADVGEAEGGRVRLDLWPYGARRGRWRVATSTWDLHNGAHVFTGHEGDYVGTASAVDPTQGLDYMHARWYSHDVGRFLSVDRHVGSVGWSQTWNRYSYCRDEPTARMDPDGRLDVRALWDRGVGKNMGVARHEYVYEITFDTRLRRFGEFLGKRLASRLLGRWSYVVKVLEEGDRVLRGGVIRVTGDDTDVDAIAGFFDGPAFEDAVRKRFRQLGGKGAAAGLYSERDLTLLQRAIREVVDSMNLTQQEKQRILDVYDIERIAREARAHANPPEVDSPDERAATNSTHHGPEFQWQLPDHCWEAECP